MRTLGIIIVLLLWLLFGYKACTDYNDCCAQDDSSTTENVDKSASLAAVAPLDNACPLAFRYQDADAIRCASWNSYQDSLINLLDDDDELQTTVFYSEGESDSLVQARVAAVMNLFDGKLDSNRIKVNLEKRSINDREKVSAISRTSFRKLNVDDNIKEIADRTLIYFPYGSSQKLNNARVEAYLDDVAERVKRTSERVSLTGYTDDRSSAESNIRLGQRRADVIKNYLVSKGVPANKIVAKSGGESNPIATNSTDDGRAKNRRTELQIIK